MVPGVIEVGRVHVSPGAQPTEARLWARLVDGGSLVCGAASGANAEPIDGDALGGCAAGTLWQISHPTPSSLDKVRGEATHFERVGSLGTERVVRVEEIAKFAESQSRALGLAPMLGVLGGAIVTSEVR